MSPCSNWKTVATMNTQIVKVGKAPLRRLFLSIQSFLFLFAYLFCSCSLNSNPLNMHSTDRVNLTSYLLCPTRMSFFVGQEMVGVRSQTFHLHRKHRAFCPWWMSLVRRSSGGVMGECERVDSELLGPKGCQHDKG